MCQLALDLLGETMVQGSVGRTWLSGIASACLLSGQREAPAVTWHTHLLHQGTSSGGSHRCIVLYRGMDGAGAHGVIHHAAYQAIEHAAGTAPAYAAAISSRGAEHKSLLRPWTCAGTQAKGEREGTQDCETPRQHKAHVTAQAHGNAFLT